MPTDITVTGTVYNAENNLKASALLTIVPIGISGALMHSNDFTVLSNASGVVTFTCAQGAQYKITGNVLGYENGLVVTMPLASSASLESLTASSLVPSTGLTIKSSGVSSFNLIGTLDFGPEFVLSESPTSELNISLAGAGISSLNALVGASQTFAAGSSGNDFAIASLGTTHTFNLPTASATKRGLLSSADWSTFNGKQAALVAGTDYLAPNGNGSLLTALNASALGSGTVPLSRISGLTNTEISASAVIAYSKLNLTGAILNADLAGSIALSKLSISGTPNGTKFLRDDGSWQTAGGGGSGDVVGPASSTDNAIARFDLATGKLLQNSGATIDDNGRVITGAGANGGIYFSSNGAGISDSNGDGRLDFIAGGSSKMDLIEFGGGNWRLRFNANGGIDAGNGGLIMGGAKVVGSRGAAVTDPAGGSVIDVEARAAIVAILDRLGHTAGHGLITR